MSERFLDALHSGKVILMDGAMGTEILRAGAHDGECLELWNLTHPDRIRAIHRAYLDAGTTCLVTNTFQASPAVLRAKGVSEPDWKRINEQAVQLARSAGDGNQFVLASVGPPPGFWDDMPRLPMLDRAADDCLTQIGWLAGVDGILIETQCCVDLIAAILRRNPSITQLIPFLVSFCYWKEGGELVCTPNQALPDAMGGYAQDESEHFAALGVNCGRDVGVADIIQVVRFYRQESKLPLFARPNAGTPTRREKSWVYPLGPEALAERVGELLAAGVSMVGGCCGTTPAHIAAMRPIVHEWNARVKC